MKYLDWRNIKLSIRSKLIIGFSVVLLILIISTFLILSRLQHTKDFAKVLTNRNLPTFENIAAINLSVQQSLAALRGLMLTGNEKFIHERKRAWTVIDTSSNALDKLSGKWKNKELKARWDGAKGYLNQLRIAQQKIEKITNTPEDNQSLTMIKQALMPKFEAVLGNITAMINQEKQQAASDERRKIFGDMADFRGNVSNAIASVQLYALTDNPSTAQQVQKFLTEAKLARNNIEKYSSLMTFDQKNKWRALSVDFRTLGSLVDKVIAMRQKKDWSQSQYLLVTTAIPVVDKLKAVMGDMRKTREHTITTALGENLDASVSELEASLNTLTTVQWVLLFIAVGIIAMTTWFLTRSIVYPIRYSIEVARRIAEGDRDFSIHVEGNDETTELLLSLQKMQKSIMNVEQELRSSEDKVQRLLNNLQERISEYKDFISIVSRGDLTKTLEVDGDDDLAQLGQYLNDMTNDMSTTASQIVVATQEISTGIRQLESAAASQAASAAEQASSVTELISVIEEIKTTSQQTLAKASELGQTAADTKNQGEKGQKSIAEMLAAMTVLQKKMSLISQNIIGLSDQTQQIGQITNVVSDIAKQSKMLALNASIEAAKAGEAGKGFAVVATEVKNLAEKSQGSTENVRVLLSDIQQATEKAVLATEEGSDSVQVNVDHANLSGEIIEALTAVIDKSTMSSELIVAAVKQESAGIDQVVMSVQEIDSAVKQFSISTEQMTQASSNLASVVEALKDTANFYQLPSRKETK